MDNEELVKKLQEASDKLESILAPNSIWLDDVRLMRQAAVALSRDEGMAEGQSAEEANVIRIGRAIIDGVDGLTITRLEAEFIAWLALLRIREKTVAPRAHSDKDGSESSPAVATALPDAALSAKGER